MELTVPDLDRCECSIQEAHSPALLAFQIGGRPPPYVRCVAAPTFVVTEREPGPDGLIGAMSLCYSCSRELVKKRSEHEFEWEKIVDYRNRIAAVLVAQQQLAPGAL